LGTTAFLRDNGRSRPKKSAEGRIFSLLGQNFAASLLATTVTPTALLHHCDCRVAMLLAMTAKQSSVPLFDEALPSCASMAASRLKISNAKACPAAGIFEIRTRNEGLCRKNKFEARAKNAK
jgi:hypothetical protein